MGRLSFALVVAAALAASAPNVQAQTTANTASEPVVWVQVEAQPSLSAAQDRARAYASSLPDVNGFALGNGWYGIALGPYRAADAREVLRVYRREGRIPRDSYIAYSGAFQQQFWPVGANLLNLPEPADTPTANGAETAAAEPEQQPAAQAEPQPDPEPQGPAEPDETVREARASERALSRAERERLQVALKWAGYYNSTIDGAFGRGTRRSMALWQEANNHVTTGVLTTGQRAQLIGQYNAILEGLDMKTVSDEVAGIEITLPTKLVKLSEYSPPFSRYESTGAEVEARVLLISQEGDQNTLYGLYDIMQTLAIVPENGPRERRGNSFSLTGENERLVSHTDAWLKDGHIKGYTLIWPTGDEERRTRVLEEMNASFTRLPGVMAPDAGGDDQNIDLVSGLEIRKPKVARSGFYLDNSGHIVTTSEAVDSCGHLTVEGEYDAEILANDAGVAILKAKTPLSPPHTATLAAREPRLQSEIAVAGFSYEGVLTAPTLTYGTLSDVKGLAGEPDLKRLALNTLPGDAGGPVFDDSGAVFGMLLPAQQGSRKLPADVSFAVSAETIRSVAAQAGLTEVTSGRSGRIAPEDLTVEALGLTVLVSCWE